MSRPIDRQSRISVIIPTLNEAASIAEALRTVLGLDGIAEVIVVDGGSKDGTPQIVAQQRGVRCLICAPGRGVQLHTGAQAATGEVLLFLHADSTPPADAAAAIRQALLDPRVVGGCFHLRFAGSFASARLLTWIYRTLLPWLGLRYGDSGYFIWRWAYSQAGGFRQYPIFEDLDLKRRLKRLGRFVRVPPVMVTSSRRFAGQSFTLVFARWTAMQVLYWLGVSPHALGRMYKHVRSTTAATANSRSGVTNATATTTAETGIEPQ